MSSKKVTIKRPNAKGYVAKDATKPLRFDITEAHVMAATCADPGLCVIGQALNEHFGDNFERVEVGATIVKIFVPGWVTRYRTPPVLRRALITFDKTGQWNLPPGSYVLTPPYHMDKLGGRPNRWHKHQKGTSGKGRPMWNPPMRATPTRIVSRVCVLTSVG